MPGFVAAPFAVQGTEYVVTVPENCAQRFLQLGGLRVLPCPLPLPALEIRQYWHERYHHDPGVRWLRGLVFELFSRPAAQSAIGRARRVRG